MTSPLSASAVLFEDHFPGTQVSSVNWDYNHWIEGPNNPSYLGQTQMRQELPAAENGMARIKMDTFNPPPGGPNSYFGSEAITKQAWDVSAGGLGFEGKFRFEGSQGGMIAGFFTYEQFPSGAKREPHDEIDFEIITTQMQKISTNVFKHQEVGTPHSYAVDGGLGIDHVYRFEWLPSVVRWFVDGNLIREEVQNVPTKPQQLHLNLWGAPQAGGPNGGPWLSNPGDPGGPPITDPTLLIAKTPAENKSYFFDVDYVKVERLNTQLGDNGHNTLLGSAASEALDGAAGDDTIDGADGNDVVAGGEGNDTMAGGTGDDSLYGGAGANRVSGGVGNDRIHTGQGADTVVDTLADLNGDTFVAFGAGDVVDIQGALAGRGDLGVSAGAGGVGGASSTMLSLGNWSFQMEGDYSGGDFMMVARGSGADTHTMLTFQTFLPALSEGSRVDPALINGIANEPFLSGDGIVSFTVELKSAVSAYANTLGAYTIAADGTISDVQILFDNTLNAASGARRAGIGTPADGERIAFFLIQDGFNKRGALPDDLSFVTPGTGAPCDTDIGIPPLLQSASLGTLSGVTIFHSLSALNPGEATQVLSGTSAGGRELLIGFEDLPTATGDNDFQDIVIGIMATTNDFLL
jgi:Ca2+-binding RTX toxin-like protein